MQERYLGTPENVRFIRAYLRALRSVDPIEVTTVEKPLRANKLKGVIDDKLFDFVVSRAWSSIEAELGIRMERIPYERYLFGTPSSESFGGFHAEASVGYNYWLQAGFTLLLNRTLVPSRLVRTAEAARNYLHDCLHHATFRSFRRVIRVPAQTRSLAKARIPEIYREQYGINFRNKDGVSYSSVGLTALSPKAINLNLLMDGVIVLTVAAHMRKSLEEMRTSRFTQTDIMVLNELLLHDPERLENIPLSSREYFKQTLLPTAEFVAFWGGEVFRIHVMRAMQSGNLGPIKRFFNKKYGERGAWEKVFRNPSFSL